MKANQSEGTITICWDQTQESVLEATLAMWPHSQVPEQGATNEEEGWKDHEQEHNRQEGNKQGKEN